VRVVERFASMNKKRFVMLILTLSVLAALPRALHRHGLIDSAAIGFFTGGILILILGLFYVASLAVERVVNLISEPPSD
jgi:O-antigen/teichoic acid export membrane protein